MQPFREKKRKKKLQRTQNDTGSQTQANVKDVPSQIKMIHAQNLGFLYFCMCTCCVYPSLNLQYFCVKKNTCGAAVNWPHGSQQRRSTMYKTWRPTQHACCVHAWHATCTKYWDGYVCVSCVSIDGMQNSCDIMYYYWSVSPHPFTPFPFAL